MFDDVTIDFDEFDKVIAKEITLEKEPEDLSNDLEDFLDIDFDTPQDEDTEIEEKPINEPADEVKEDIEDPDVETDEKEPLCNEDETSEDEPEHFLEHKSLAQIYESKQSRKKNKLVESLLVDNVVDDITNVLTSTLKSHGVTKAETIVTLGMILNKMLNASDAEVTAPDFLDGVIGEYVDNADLNKVILKSIEQALESNGPVPGIEASDISVNIAPAKDAEETVETVDNPEDK